MSAMSYSSKDLTAKMDGAIEHCKRELAGLRTGRASLGLLENIRVDYYGTQTPLKQVANLAVPESRLITIQPWEPPLIREIEKAIQGSSLGLTPSNDGKIIRVPIPPLTEDRRKDLLKVCKKYGEETRVHIRGMRRHGNEEIKNLQKASKLTEDEEKKLEHDIQKLTDRYIEKVDALLKKKEEEILDV